MNKMTEKMMRNWTPQTEEHKKYLESSHSPDESEIEFPDHFMGFFKWNGVDPDRVRQDFPGEITEEEKSIVIEYMHHAAKGSTYRGTSCSRIDGSRLGSSDMITPDGKWLFPQAWDSHYIKKHDIRPPQKFIDDATAWLKG